MLEKGDSGVWSGSDTPPDYYDVWIIPDGTPGTIPTKLSELSDDTTHRVVTDAEKTTWNNKSNFSGSYPDLTNKPNLTVYEQLSNKVTSISSNSTDTEYPSAKAVYTYANNKVINNNHLTDNTSQTYSGRIIDKKILDLDNKIIDKSNIVTIQFSIIIPSGTVEKTFPIDFPTGFSKNNSVILSAMWTMNPSAESVVWQPLYNNYFVDDNTVIPQFKIELGDTSNNNPNKINLTFSSPDSTSNVIVRNFKVTLMKHDATSNIIY